MEKIEKDKIISMLMSEDGEIREFIIDYIRLNYNTNFMIYRGYDSVSEVKVWTFDNSVVKQMIMWDNILADRILDVILLFRGGYEYKDISDLIDLILLYNDTI